MKKHNTVKVVLITILVLLVLTWIFPAAYYSGQYVDQGRVQMGLSELFNYPMTVISYFGHIAILVLFVGSFYGILYKIPAYRKFLDKIVSLFKGKEFWFLSIVTVLLALGVSFAGLQLGFALFIPFFISLILLMGYDKKVAALCVVGGISAGYVGTTYAAGNTSLLTSLLTLDFDFQIGVRFVILLVAIVLVIFNILMYVKAPAKKKVLVVENKKEDSHKKDEVVAKKVEVKTTSKSKTTKTKSVRVSSTSTKNTKNTKNAKSSSKKKNHNKAALRDEEILVIKENVFSKGENDDYLIPNRVESKHKIWPLIVFFSLLFVLLVLAFISWGDTGFGVKFFDDLTSGFQEFELFGFPIFSKIYGTINAFGNWSVIDLFLPMALVILILAIIYKVKINDIFDGAVEGAKKAAAPAFVVVLVYTILVLVTYHPFQLPIYKFILGWTKGFNIITTTLVTFLSAFFNIEPAYVFQSVLPYYVTVITKAADYPLVGVIAQSMYGVVNLFAPTSLILMVALSYLKISYKDWLKTVWKLLVELFVVLLIIFIILALL